MSQVLPLRLNVKGCSGAALPPPGPCSRECRCEETRITLVASYRHTSKPQICPFKQWQEQQKGLFYLKIFNRAGGACSYLHDWKVVVQVGRTCSSPLLDWPLSENCWHHVIILFLQQLFPIFFLFSGAEHHLKSHIQSGVWEYETNHVRAYLKHIVAFGLHLLCTPWRTVLPFQSSAESSIKMKNNHTRVNPDKTEQSVLGWGKHV